MKLISNKKIFFLLIIIFSISLFSKIVFAVWDGQPYEPGAIDNPECLPSQTNCDVLPAVTVETDPIFSASDAFTISGINISNWNSAYNWGDHSQAGYLTSYTETDPIFTAWNKSTGISITESQITDLQDYLTSYTETDPIFSASDAFDITDTDITNWDTAYGWGDHSQAGYETSLSFGSGLTRLVNTISNDLITGTTGVQTILGSLDGNGLIINAGRATQGGANQAGGDLTLKSGISTGSGSSAMHFYTTPLAPQTVAIGDVYGGGIIAYILQVGDPGYEVGKIKGIIAATTDQGSVAWITGGSTQTTINGNTGTALGTGSANTAAMAAQTGYTGGAAKVCLDYRGGGYSDWYLPSRDELQKLWDARIAISLQTINSWQYYYHSSSESSASTNWQLYANSDWWQVNGQKSGGYLVRPIRSFTVDSSSTDNISIERMTILGNGNVGIGTTTPGQLLEVNGIAKMSTGIISPKWYPTSDSTTALQINKADGTSNILNIDTTNSRVGIGTITPSKLLEVNGDALINGVTVGMGNNDTYSSNTILGNSALANPVLYSTRYSTAIGTQVLTGASGARNTGIGASAFIYLTTGYDNIALGVNAGSTITGGGANRNQTSNNSIYIGNDTKAYANGDTNEIIIGSGLTGIGSNSVNLANTIYATGTNGASGGSVGIGTTTPNQQLELTGSLRLPTTTTSTTGVIYKDGNRFIHDFHHPTGRGAVPNGGNLFIGINAGNFTTGSTADYSSQASNNIGIGVNSLTSTTLGASNIGIGNNSLYSLTGGENNIGIGSGAAYSLNNTGGTIAVGSNALYYLNENNPYNIAIGVGAGRMNAALNGNYAGSYNIFFGYQAYPLNSGDTNEIVIGADARGIGSNTVVLGNNNVVTTALKGNVGIGTTSPADKLHVSGGGILLDNNQYLSGTQTNGVRLGILSLDSGNNLVIRTNTDIIFKMVNTEKARLLNNGNFGIGTASPSQMFSVNENFKVTSTGSVFIPNGQGIGINPYIGAANSNIYFNVGTVSIGGTTDFQHLNANFIVKNSGNVGIGTVTPTYKLDVKGMTTNDVISSDIGFNINKVVEPVQANFTGVASAGSGLEIGLYWYLVSFTTTLGETKATLINGRPETTAGNQRVTLTIPTSTDPRVTGRKIYRVKVNQHYNSDYLLTTINNNVDVTYVDSTPDVSLTGAIQLSFWKFNSTSKQITINDTAAMFLDPGKTSLGFAANPSGTGGGNTTIGYNSGNYLTTGTDNTAVGTYAGQSIMAGTTNSFFGNYAGWGQRGGSTNVGIGNFALGGHSGGNANVAIGNYAMGTTYGSSGGLNVAIGEYSGTNHTTGTNNIWLGYYSGSKQTTESNQLIIDNLNRSTAAREISEALIYGVTNATPANQILSLGGGGKVGIGTTAPGEKLEVDGDILFGSTNSTTTLRGRSAWGAGNFEWKPTTDYGVGSFGIRFDSTSAGSGKGINFYLYGYNGEPNRAFRFINGLGGVEVMRIEPYTGNVGIGTMVPTEKLDVNGNINIPTTTTTVGQIKQNGVTLMHTYGGITNFFLGQQSGNLNMTGTGNTAMGYDTLASNSTGANNMAFGTYALYGNIDGSGNTAMGSGVMRYAGSGGNNTGIGMGSMATVAPGNDNTAIGAYSLYRSTGNKNTAIGDRALFNNNSSNNIGIGYSAGYYETGSDKLIIDNQTRGDEATSRTAALVYGVMSATPTSQILSLGGGGKVGIGVTTPTHKLDINGHLNFVTVAAPTTPPTVALAGAGAGNVDNGLHYYYIKYVTAEGQSGYINSSEASIEVVDKTTDGKVNLTNIPISPDNTVTSRKIYRSKSGERYYAYYVGTVANNTSTTYTDNTADSGLVMTDNWYRPGNSTAGKMYIDNSLFFSGDEYNTKFGYRAGPNTTTGEAVTIFGNYAANSLTSGSQSVFIGSSAGYNFLDKIGNTLVGAYAGGSGVGQYYNTLIGYTAGYKVAGTRNTLVGNASGYGNTGDYNTFLGAETGKMEVATSNGIHIGNYAGAYETASLKLIIDSVNRVTEARGRSEALIYGVASTTPANQILSLGGGGNVGIGTTTPEVLLHVSTDTIKKLILSEKTISTYQLQMGILGDVKHSFITSIRDGYAYTNLLLQHGGGSVGIGTGADWQIPVSAKLQIRGLTSNSSGYALNVDNYGYASLLSVRNDGNVGIGTTNPGTKLEIGSSDLGDGVAGPIITIGRNTNATNTGAGSINFLDKAGNSGYIWQDSAGYMRINTLAPSNANDTAGTIIGDQTSIRETKQDINDYEDYESALSMIVNAPLHTFRYIKEVNGYGADSLLAKTRIGFIADEVDPIFMVGNSIDQVSVNGLLMASVKDLNLKLEGLAIPIDEEIEKSFIERFYEKLVIWLGSSDNGLEQICVKKSDGTSFCVNGDQLEQAVNGMNSTPISTSSDLPLAPEPIIVDPTLPIETQAVTEPATPIIEVAPTTTIPDSIVSEQSTQ